MPHVRVVATDLCQFGSPGRRKTTLMCSRIDHLDLDRCERSCTGINGRCSNGRRHVQLTGSDRHGISLASVFPSRFCHSLAFSLTAHARVVPEYYGCVIPVVCLHTRLLSALPPSPMSTSILGILGRLLDSLKCQAAALLRRVSALFRRTSAKGCPCNQKFRIA